MKRDRKGIEKRREIFYWFCSAAFTAAAAWQGAACIRYGAELRYITTFLPSKTAIDAQANIGIALFQQGKYQDAMNIFDSILANDDNHVPSLYYKGQCLERLGFLPEANQYKNMVYKNRPKLSRGRIHIRDFYRSAITSDNRCTPAPCICNYWVVIVLR